MMKDKRIKLENLKVRSFVTTIKNGEEATIRGGVSEPGQTSCNTPNPTTVTIGADCTTTTQDTNGTSCLQSGITCGGPNCDTV